MGATAGGTASVGVAVGKLSGGACKTAEVGTVRRCKPRTHVAVDIGKVQQPRLMIELHSPVMDKLAGFIRTNREQMPLPYGICKQGEFAGKALALCGAGPSLQAAVIEGVDQVWACNSALPYLIGKGVDVTAGVAIDQTPQLLVEWESRPDVQYYIASSCDPAIAQHLRGRRVSWFHNYVGIPDEVALYKQWPKPMLMVTIGHTVVSRVIGLAHWMGFERIDVYGADCALGPEDVAHANGEGADAAYRQPLIMTGEVNGRKWRTRPDMLIGAVDLVRQVRMYGGTIRLMGDTLPVALLGKSDEFLNSVARALRPGELPPIGD